MSPVLSSALLLCSVSIVSAGIASRNSAGSLCRPCPSKCPSAENCECGKEVDQCGCCVICSHCDLDSICKECDPSQCPVFEGDRRCECDVEKDECGCCDICMNCPYQLCRVEGKDRCRDNTTCKPPSDLPKEIAIKQHILGQCVHEYEGF